MAPPFIINDVKNKRRSYVESFSQPRELASFSLVNLSNQLNAFISELCQRSILTTAGSPLLSRVLAVIEPGPEEQMSGVDAWWVVTFMKNALALWYSAIVNNPAEPVGPDRLVLNAEITVTTGAVLKEARDRTSPKPARFSLFYFCPKSIKDLFIHWVGL